MFWCLKPPCILKDMALTLFDSCNGSMMLSGSIWPHLVIILYWKEANNSRILRSKVKAIQPERINSIMFYRRNFCIDRCIGEIKICWLVLLVVNATFNNKIMLVIAGHRFAFSMEKTGLHGGKTHRSDTNHWQAL